MLETKPNTPYLRWTPRRVKLDDGGEVDVPDRMSLAEFEGFPWPEGQRWELLWGIPVMTPSPTYWHQDLLADLLVFLKESLPAVSGLKVVPGVDVRMPGANSYVCPDLAVISPTEVEDLNSLPLVVVPKLVVELLSPSTQGNDLGAKLDAYAATGISEYWIANPRTGHLFIYVGPSESYKEQVPEDGFVASPLLGRKLRIRRDGLDFHIETRDQ